MERQIIWSRLDTPGLEHFHLTQRPDEILADGLILGLEDGLPYRLRYHLRCDPAWRVRHLHLDPLNGQPPLTLTADGLGHWFDPTGAPLPHLTGCIDVDITATPFTNTLPLRRLTLQPGQTATIKVAYLPLPHLHPTLDHQRYTRLTPPNLYQFEQLTTGFTAQIQVDPDGLIQQYPGLFTRLWPS